MRVSTASLYQASVNAMLNQQALLSKTQIQLSTGRSFATPGDDPDAAVRAQTLSQSLKTNQQYQSNIGAAQSRLQFEDSALDTADTLLQQARELAIQGLNGSLTDTDRKALGLQAQQVLDQMLGVANTQNASGEHIFGGSLADAPPFALESAPRNSAAGIKSLIQGIDYSGLRLDVADPPVTQSIGLRLNGGAPVAVSVPPGPYNTAQELAHAYNDAINASALRDQATAQVGKDGSVEFLPVDPRSKLDYLPSPPPAPKQFDLGLYDGVNLVASTTVNVESQKYDSADQLAAAINQGIAATSLKDQVVAQARDGFIEFVASGAAADLTLTVQNDANGMLADLGITDPESSTDKPAAYVYRGDLAQRSLQVGIQRSIPDSDNGFDIFQDVPSSAGISALGTPEGKQSLLNTLRSLVQALQGDLGDFRSAVTGSKDLSDGISYSSLRLNVNDPPVTQALSLTLDSGAPVAIAIAPGPYVTAQDLADAYNSAIGATALNGLARALPRNDGSVAFAAIDPNSRLVAQADPAQAPMQFKLTLGNGDPVPVEVAALDYATPQDLALAINQGIAATGLKDRVSAQVRGGAIEFVANSPEQSVGLVVSGDADGFLASVGIEDPQTSPPVNFENAASAALADIDSGLQSVLDTRAKVGSRLNSLDQQQTMQDKFILDTQSDLSKLEDLDYADAISRFSQQQAVLQASQQAFVQVQRLSLFNYL
jgi:flagellar hook-associated protein 3 FlgL